jgi:hypothetical protein
MIRTWYRLSFVVVLCLVAAASAPAVPPAKSSTAGGTGNAQPYAAQVAALRAARLLLEQADHDYKGHRANAVKLVTAAIHALHPPKANATGKAHAAKSGAAQTGAKTGGNTIPQAVSDAQLKQAMGQITAVQGQLTGAQGAAPAAAVTALQKAVQELQTALSIK